MNDFIYSILLMIAHLVTKNWWATLIAVFAIISAVNLFFDLFTSEEDEKPMEPTDESEQSSIDE